ncbi:MAG: glutathione peroxidase [Melioribacteraceae bacterium]|nr:glutathione peroxidase [Melioribacteraceae bacterium]
MGTLTFSQDKSIYDFEVETIAGDSLKLEQYKDNVILIVNTASKCGYTYQYEDLEKLYKKYSKDGLVILGFPCNQFGKQEPGTEKEIKEFCKLNYGVTFPMFSKIDVNGENENPLYSFLKSKTDGKEIKWNFEKFLINKSGKVLERFNSKVKPFDLEDKINGLLK